MDGSELLAAEDTGEDQPRLPARGPCERKHLDKFGGPGAPSGVWETVLKEDQGRGFPSGGAYPLPEVWPETGKQRLLCREILFSYA